MNCQKDCIILKGREEIIKALKEDLQDKDREIYRLQNQIFEDDDN